MQFSCHLAKVLTSPMEAYTSLTAFLFWDISRYIHIYGNRGLLLTDIQKYYIDMQIFWKLITEILWTEISIIPGNCS